MTAISLFERPTSGGMTGEPPTLRKEYGLSGIEDEYIAYAMADAAIDTSIATPQGILYRNHNIQLDHEGFGMWGIAAVFEKEKRETGTFKFSFDTTGATIHIKASKETIGKYPATAPDLKQAVGVNAQGDVEGADIIIPALKLNYSFTHPAGMMNEAKARFLSSKTGMTNSVPWHGFQQGELLFLGATGSGGTDSPAEVSYGIAASVNATGLTIGDITGIAKKGHHLVSISFKKAVDAGKPATQPEYVYVDRVYDEIDFYATLGF